MITIAAIKLLILLSLIGITIYISTKSIITGIENLEKFISTLAPKKTPIPAKAAILAISLILIVTITMDLAL